MHTCWVCWADSPRTLRVGYPKVDKNKQKKIIQDCGSVMRKGIKEGRR